jgi:hypothetical protein
VLAASAVDALPAPGASAGQVRDLNELGVSAGYVLTATDAVPVRWDAQGQATTLQVPPVSTTPPRGRSATPPSSPGTG